MQNRNKLEIIFFFFSQLQNTSIQNRVRFFRLAVAVGRQRALHTENSGFASPTLGRHISTFRGYQILFYIRNPYKIQLPYDHDHVHILYHKEIADARIDMG
jgi:hypothetical protein